MRTLRKQNLRQKVRNLWNQENFFFVGIEILLIIRNILLIVSLFALSVHAFARQMDSNFHRFKSILK